MGMASPLGAYEPLYEPSLDELGLYLRRDSVNSTASTVHGSPPPHHVTPAHTPPGPAHPDTLLGWAPTSHPAALPDEILDMDPHEYTGLVETKPGPWN